MIALREVEERDYPDILNLRLAEGQKKFLDCPQGIVARGTLYRNQAAKVWGIFKKEKLVGLCLIRDLDEEPCAYDLQQFMLTESEQGKGYGRSALKILVKKLKQEAKYPKVDVAVASQNNRALHFFKANGFQETGYIDESCPDLINLSYDLSEGGSSYELHGKEYFLDPQFFQAFQVYLRELGIDLEDDWSELEESFAANHKGLCYTFNVPSGEVLGFLQFEVNELTHFFFQEKFGFIREFWIRQDLRQQGHGGKLLSLCEDYLRKQGVARVLLTSDRAGAFYEKKGYGLYESIEAKNHNPVYTKWLK